MYRLPIILAFIVLATSSCSSGDHNKNLDSKDTSGRANVPVVLSDHSLSDDWAKVAAHPALVNWASSFDHFSIDSFVLTQKAQIGNVDYEVEDQKNFMDLYGNAIIYSPDSSRFIDLMSASVSLEKKGNKVIATGDVDQAVTLRDNQKKVWKQISFFGPSAGIEEAAWLSPLSFLLAGMFVNDEGRPTPLIMIGNLQDSSFRWFQANQVRPATSTYKSGAEAKLKIDEWE